MVLTEKEKRILEQHFKFLDKDGSGVLEPREFLQLPHLTQNPMVMRMFQILDKNKDGKISYLEFLDVIQTISNVENSDHKIELTFKVYDMDEDGFISNGDLFKVVKMMVGNVLNDDKI